MVIIKSFHNDTLGIVIPAYNEADNVLDLLNEWHRVLDKLFPHGGVYIIIVNDGSTDDTKDIVIRQGYTDVILVDKENGGHGEAVLFGYHFAITKKVDYIFQIDADRQTSPGEFADFWKRRHEYDAIIGNRKRRGDGIARWFVERVVCVLLFFYFGVRVPDANAPFRLMKTALVQKYIDRLPDNYALPNIIFTMYFSHYKENILFQEISFRSRTAGSNSINFNRIIKIGFRALKDFNEFKKNM